MVPAPTDPPPPGDSGAAPEAARARGRGKWIILGALGLGLVALWVFSGGGSSNKKATLTFVGFTNYDGKTRAFFWFTNGTRASLFSTRFASQRDGTKWVYERTSTISVHQESPKQDEVVDWNPPHQALLVSFVVKEAALPLRTITDVSERPTGLDRISTALHQWWLDHVQRIPAEAHYGSYYSVTNEFHPKP